MRGGFVAVANALGTLTCFNSGFVFFARDTSRRGLLSKYFRITLRGNFNLSGRLLRGLNYFWLVFWCFLIILDLECRKFKNWYFFWF